MQTEIQTSPQADDQHDDSCDCFECAERAEAEAQSLLDCKIKDELIS